MRAVVFTLGCKVNEAESAGIMSALEEDGWEVSDRLSPADIYVLNTCAVTREAEKKSRQLVTRAKRFNPQARVYVCGCASQKDAEQFRERGVTFVTGARDKDGVVAEIAKTFGGKRFASGIPKRTRTRAFVKIQDGCNNFCSYCVIPYLRGRETSRRIEEIVEEIKLTDCPEIVLNGINISSFNDGGAKLPQLISALKGINKRIRLGSLECGIITEELLAALRELPDFAEQFHLSLQSGSTAVLKSMNRRYSREEYLEKCALIYSHFPEAAITTDIIAGFCTETEEDFLQSLSIVEEAGLARVHAFAFSPREGTAAFKMKDLPADIKSGRLHRLLAAAERAREAFTEKFVGVKTDFIAEDREGEYVVGYTGNYIKIYIGEPLPAGEKAEVIIKKKFRDGAYAELCKNSRPLGDRD